MVLRAPCIPLLNIDPYFSVWSATNKLTDSVPMHWTGHPNTILGTVEIDGEISRFMGKDDSITALKQTDLKIDAFTSEYTFENDKITLSVKFLSPRIPSDVETASEPISYVYASFDTNDGENHDVKIKFAVSEELCLNEKGQYQVKVDEIKLRCGSPAVRMGAKTQKVLWRSGDDVRIDWGYFYLAVSEGTVSSEKKEDGMTYVCAEADLTEDDALFIFAYDDVASIQYFGENLKSYWNKDGKNIKTLISEAFGRYDEVVAVCTIFDTMLFADATRAGGEKYAELLELAVRQVMAAHKIAVTADGDILFISKECFSNGCAATVDVSYPSIPMFLVYNPELVRGMMRPIFRYAESEVWPFDFAPHDCGQYPLVNGQVYSGGLKIDGQMPLEECGNMLVMAAAVTIADDDNSFALEHLDTLTKWADYLAANGEDPANQLCTDDFAGHMAHNCNLTLKAVMGIAGYSLILALSGMDDKAKEYMEKAKAMATSWVNRASNGDGSYRLAFDRDGTWSMKYNAVWDKLFGTEIFPREVIESEVASNFKHMNPYGMPLDNRAKYTKSDWLVWTATMTNDRDTFLRYVEPLWNAYNSSRSRIPMTDWYDTVTGDVIGFRHRTVQGGLFIKLLDYYGTMKF